MSCFPCQKNLIRVVRTESQRVFPNGRSFPRSNLLSSRSVRQPEQFVKQMSASSIITSSVPEDETVDQLSEFLTDLTHSDQAIRTKHRWYLPIRAVCDLLLALCVIVVSAPVIAIAALLVKLTSRGPAFYCQTRVGKHGRSFTLIKLRTMVHQAEAISGPVWAEQEDARVTPIGRFLRNTHLDEFPQLLNVLLGQMSLIGPRPERPEFVAKLEWDLPHYRTRLRLRPGITGLTQLLLPPDTDLDGVRRKLVFDMFYVRYVNPWLDLRILCSTACHLGKVICHYLWKLVALPRARSVEKRLCRVFEGQLASRFTEQTEESLSE